MDLTGHRDTELRIRQDHNSAVTFPIGFERPVIQSLKAWARYAEIHGDRYEAQIGNDGALGDFWVSWGLDMRGLLNGNTGRLHCGHLDTFIRETIIEHGGKVPV